MAALGNSYSWQEELGTRKRITLNRDYPVGREILILPKHFSGNLCKRHSNQALKQNSLSRDTTLKRQEKYKDNKLDRVRTPTHPRNPIDRVLCNGFTQSDPKNCMSHSEDQSPPPSQVKELTRDRQCVMVQPQRPASEAESHS